MAILTYQKLTKYHNLYENMAPARYTTGGVILHILRHKYISNDEPVRLVHMYTCVFIEKVSKKVIENLEKKMFF